MNAYGWVIVILALLVVAALVVLAARRNRRRSALKERFGPEYDRAIRQTRDRRGAEQRLQQLSSKRDALEIRDLSPEATAGYRDHWERTQARFVDEPGQAVADADHLVNEVMRERGYPLEDFDERAALLATDHPDVVEHYRAAHDAYARHLRAGEADTEDLRKAFVHYRSLFVALTPEPAGRPAVEGGSAVEGRESPATPPTSPTPTTGESRELREPAPAAPEPAPTPPPAGSGRTPSGATVLDADGEGERGPRAG